MYFTGTVGWRHREHGFKNGLGYQRAVLTPGESDNPRVALSLGQVFRLDVSHYVFP